MNFVSKSLLLRSTANVVSEFHSGSVGMRLLSTSKIKYDDKSKKDLETMVTNEKRGIFRVLDIGLPKPMRARRAGRSNRKTIKAIPR